MSGLARVNGLSRDVLDASVLGCPPVADLLLRLARAVEVPFTPLWSKKILKEVYRIHTGPGVNWGLREATDFRIRLMREFPSSRVVRYEYWLPRCTNPEPARHVLACAITGKADTIVTYDLESFGREHLARWQLRAVHPDDFLLRLYALFPERILRELPPVVPIVPLAPPVPPAPQAPQAPQEAAAAAPAPRSRADALAALVPHVPLFVSAVADRLWIDESRSP